MSKKKNSSSKNKSSSNKKKNEVGTTNNTEWNWGELEITLQSDICIGNGYAFFGTIDTDVVYDRNGLPFLPARRLKGVLRESAEFLRQVGLLQEDEGSSIEDIFGCSNSQNSNGIQVGNGYINNFDEISKNLDKLKKENILEELLSKEKILDLFTSVKAQTRIKDGVAYDNSLRFIRVINQYTAMEQRKDKPLKFTAGIRYKNKKSWKDNLEIIAKATRNIGINRNRGLGSVTCVFRPKSDNVHVFNGSFSANVETIKVFLQNIDPLVISGGDKNDTLSFIPGRTFAGALAGTYLSNAGTSAEDDVFFDLFLNGKTKFSNFTIYDGNKSYYPAPYFLNKLKKTGVYVNTLQYSDKISFSNDSNLNTGNGNQPKKMKGKYVSICIGEDESICVEEIEPNKRVIFHHRRGDDKLLYSQTALESGQVFAGTISYPKEHYKTLYNLLKNTRLVLGKSRTAQYGKCQIININKYKSENKKLEINAGDVIYISLASPGIFQCESGVTVDPEKVYYQIANELGFDKIIEEPKDGKIMDGDVSCPYCIVEEYIVHGYQSVWNLPRAVMPCIQSGSVFVYKIRNDAQQNKWQKLPYEINKSWVGKRNHEGYGEIQMFCSKKIPYDIQGIDKKNQDQNEMKNEEINPSTQNINIPTIIRPMLSIICQKEMYGCLMSGLLDKVTERKFDMSPSTLGRITLMLTESIEQNTEGINSFKEFWNKVNSIKGEKGKKEITDLLQMYFCNKEGILDSEKILQCTSNKEEKYIRELMEILSVCQTERNINAENNDKKVKEIVKSFWGELLMEVLTNQKYLNKFSEGSINTDLKEGDKL